METSNHDCPLRRSRRNRGDTPQQLLSTFLETVFIPLEAAGATGTYQSQCRRAVKEFSKSLGRHAVLADLNPEELQRFTEWLSANMPERLQTQLKQRVRSIWRYAATLGVAKEIDQRERPKRQRPALEMTPGTLSHFFETVYLPQRLVGVEENSIDRHRRKIADLSSFIGHPVKLEDLSDSLMAAFFNSQLAMGQQKATVNNHRGHLFAVWRFAAELGRVTSRPSIRKLREANDEPDAWTEEEFSRLLANCGRLSTLRPNVLPAADLMRAVLLLAYWTGLRRGTLMKLRWSDVDLANRWITVPGNVMKGRRGKKFRIGADAAEALQAIQIVGAVNVLPPIDWKRFYADFDVLLEAAGVPASKRRGLTKLHKVRRTTATLLAVRQGVGAASSLLGHSTEQVTLRYIDPSKLQGNDMTSILPILSTKEGGAP